MVDISKYSLKELLGYAVRSEIDSHQTYSTLANKLKNHLLKEKFQLLAYEETKHKETLENLFGSLFPGETLQVPEKQSGELFKKIQVTPSSSLVDILKQAMDSEKAAESFYTHLAKQVENTKKRYWNT